MESYLDSLFLKNQTDPSYKFVFFATHVHVYLFSLTIGMSPGSNGCDKILPGMVIFGSKRCTIFTSCFSSNNMLYPREDRSNRLLLYACRNCDHQEEAVEHRVYRNSVMPQAM